MKARAPIHFDIVAVNLDQGHPGFPKDTLPNYLKHRGVAFHIEDQDTYSIVKRVIPEGKTHVLALLAPAPWCALSRRQRTQGDKNCARPSSRRYFANTFF